MNQGPPGDTADGPVEIIDLFLITEADVREDNLGEIAKSVDKYRRRADLFAQRLAALHTAILQSELAAFLARASVDNGLASYVRLVQWVMARVPISFPFITPALIRHQGLADDLFVAAVEHVGQLDGMKYLTKPPLHSHVSQAASDLPANGPGMAVRAGPPSPTRQEGGPAPPTVANDTTGRKVLLRDVQLALCPFLRCLEEELGATPMTVLTWLGPCSKFKYHLYFVEIYELFERRLKSVRQKFYRREVTKRFNVYKPAVCFENRNLVMPPELTVDAISTYFDEELGDVNATLKTPWGKRQWKWFKNKQLHDMRKHIVEKRRKKRVRRSVGRAPNAKRVRRVVDDQRGESARCRGGNGRFVSAKERNPLLFTDDACEDFAGPLPQPVIGDRR